MFLFAMSKKVLDQLGRTGTFDHYIRRKATMVDIGLDTVTNVAKHADYLSLTGNGVFGKEFETKLNDRKERNKEYKDLVPENEKRDFKNNLKRKAQPNKFTRRGVLILQERVEISVRTGLNIIPVLTTGIPAHHTPKSLDSRSHIIW